MKNNNYALFYKKTAFDSWHSERPNMPINRWEYYAYKNGYVQYGIKDFNIIIPSYLHLMADVVKLSGKYYLPEETIPYPQKEPKLVKNFEISVKWKDETDYYPDDYMEQYAGCSGLLTLVETNFGHIYFAKFKDSFADFLKKLKKENHAVFHNPEITPFKWLCWLKDDKIRVLQQNYEERITTKFDVLVDKNLFFKECNKMLKQMKEYEKKDRKRYQEYALKKYGKLLKNSIPCPETEPLQIDSFEITTDVQTNTENDFEEFFKTGDELYTKVYTYLNFGNKTEEVVLIAEQFVEYFPWFIHQLKEIENAVYEDKEYTETKLHAWLKEDFVRLVYEDLSSDESEIVFDIAVNKNFFFKTAEKMIIQMKEIAEKEQSRYVEYIKKERR